MTDSAAQLAARVAELSASERLLLVAPGPQGAEILAGAQKQFGSSCVALSAGRAPLANLSCRRVVGFAARLPFARQSFTAVAAFGTLGVVHPAWTMLAEFSRVLTPNGKLVIVEPARSLLARLWSGRGAFSLEEARLRLARAGFEIARVETDAAVAEIPEHVYCLCGIKRG